MNEPLHLTSAIHSTRAETARSLRRRRIVWLGVVGWTVFVGVAVWWWLQGNAGPSVWIVHEADPLQPAVAERFHAFFRTDIGLQRAYPWVLFGPYVALVALYFPLERGRLRLSLPLNAAMCAAFVAASHAINARTSLTGAKMGIVTSQRRADLPPGSRKTNGVQIEIVKTDAGNLLRELMPKSPADEKPANRALPDTTAAGRPEISDPSLTNLFAYLPHGFKPPVPPSGLSKLSLLSILLDLLAYGAVVSLAHSVHFYRRFREREHRALFLESNLANARLNALRAQLQPHFLFNSLNAIAALLRRDSRLAEATLMSLSELLRLALSQSEKQEVCLREEMKFVQHYLEIQQTRFGDKLRIEQDIEPAALDCLVPTLLLQPLAENALRHGIEPAENAGLVRLTAHRRDGSLVLTVEDDGVGFSSSAIDLRRPKTPGPQTNTASSLVAIGTNPAVGSSGGTGIGLTNLRARLETLFGAQQKLELIPRPEGGVTVRIEIPWRPATPFETPGSDSCKPS